jgi:hypothetical protein
MVGFLQWWYTRGWARFAEGLLNRLRGLTDFFSLGLLVKTFFSPFRQISAYGDDNASLQQQFAQFWDKMLSRIIGAVVRFMIIIGGIVTLFVVTTIGFVLTLAWPLMPLMPIAGVVLSIMGVTL